MSSSTVPYSRPIEGAPLDAMWAASAVIDEYTRHDTLAAHHRTISVPIESERYVRSPWPVGFLPTFGIDGMPATAKRLSRMLYSLSAPSREKTATISGLIGWGYQSEVPFTAAVATWTPTAVTIDVGLSDDSAAQLSEGDVIEVTGSEVMVINLIQPKAGAAGTYTLTVERACAGTEASAHDGATGLALLSMPSDLQYVAITIAKRWTQTRHQPGAGAYLSEDGVPASTALIYNLRRALSPYKGAER